MFFTDCLDGFISRKCKAQTLFGSIMDTIADKVLCIGDNLDTDVKGGIEHGFDTCWCNYNNEINEKYNTNYEITKLTDLIEIL
mgnify:CR=1 FL=1